MRIQPAAPNESLGNYSARVSARYERDWQETQAKIAAGGGGGGAVSSVFARTGAVVAASGDYTFAQIGSKPTTLAGYGITDGITAAAAAATYQPIGSYLTANQTITLSGDVTGSGATAITATLAASGVTAGTYGQITVDAKGRVTAATKGDERIASATLGSAAATLIDTGATAFANYDFIEITIDVVGYSGSDTIALTLNNLANSHQYFWETASAVVASGATVTRLGGANQGTNQANIKLAPANSANARGIRILIHNRPEATEKLVEVWSSTGTNSTGTAPARDLCGAAVITGASTRITRIKLATAGGANLLAGTSCVIKGWNV